ncbi:ABC transporter substrate-binding protein [Falsiroseomonas bella]|uniref:ABC transporter substrate-binding protein n=1 Tax=Falsiroseomonas bella TaxID=2184016 RepID=A0A317F8E8_9PROT|nr:ABC transporter substrate-binding protein [Falsiroseomonas bella]PWS35431.1 ABC transporter substrate-binding protein [Falsiroseomonas bella]
MRRLLLATALAAGLLPALAPAALGPALAQPARTLTVGMGGVPTGYDPHYHSTNNNNAQLRQIFNPLIDLDTQGRPFGVLAESWRVVDDLTWEFRLREGIRFHDGTPFGPEDVAFTVARVPTVPNSPGPFTTQVRPISRVEIVDARTVRLHTSAPTPFLERDIAQVMILSRSIHANAQLADFNAGRALVGTGAYRHVALSLGERHEIARNPDFWGERAAWDRVVTRFVTNPGARVAALLAGDVDLIDAVPVTDVQRLSADPRIALFATDSNTTAFMFPDAARDNPPHITDKQGNPLARNPLADLRVRQAISLAMPREAIVERLMQGQGSPAEQIASRALPDRAQGMPPLQTDLARARVLLREAGYPDGFRMTIHGPNGFIVGDADILQAVAQALTRIGIETRVEVIPPAPFFTRATQREFSFFFSTFTANSAAVMLRQVVMTRNPAQGLGAFNRGHYSSPAVDGPLAEALRTMDAERRAALTAQAMRAAVDDLAVIPLMYVRVNWAGLRNKVRYDAHPSWFTNALLASPAE